MLWWGGLGGHGENAEWWSGGMAEWQNSGMAEWQNGHYYSPEVHCYYCFR